MATQSDGKVIISTELDNSRLSKGVKEVSGKLGGLKSVVKSLGTAIGVAFSVASIARFAAESVKAANALSDALVGLQSILDGQGRSFSGAKKFLEEYTADGLIPMTNAVAAYKNLASRGYDDGQIRNVMQALKDASAFGRQSSYTMGEAVQSATEGLKNENSVLVDNAGVTKNVAKMWEEYAASIGTTANNLTQQQKIQAEYNGIMEETRFQTGDAAKVAGTLTGQLMQLSFNFNNLKVAVGNALKPIVQSFLPVINAAVAAVTRFANAVASVVGALFGGSMSSTSAAVEEVADSYGSAAAGAEELAESTKAAGKAAKRYLAGFDEITRIGESAAGGGGSGASGGGGTVAASTTVTTDGEVNDQISPKVQAVIDKIHELVAPLKDIDFTPLRESLGKLGKSFSDLGRVIGESLEWAWFNVLVPVATWTIEEFLPTFAELIASAMDLLRTVITRILAPLGRWLWANFLQPIAEKTGDAVIAILEAVTDLFRDLTDLIAGDTTFADFIGNLTPLQTLIVGIAGAFAAISAVSTGMTVFKTISGFFASIKAMNAAGLIGKIAEVFVITASGARTLSEAMKLVFGPGSILAGIGAVIGGAIVAVTNFVSMLKNGFSWVKEALMLVGIAIAAVGAVILGAPAAVAGIVAGIVAAIATAVVLIKEHWAQIAEWFGKAMERVSTFFTDCWNGIRDAWGAVCTWFDENVIQPVLQVFRTLRDGIANAASEAWGKVKDFFAPAVDWFRRLFDSIRRTVKDVFHNIGVLASGCWDVIKAVWGVVTKWFDSNIIKPVSKFFTDLWEDVENLAVAAWDGIQSVFSTISDWINNNIVTPVGKFFSGMWDSVKSGAAQAWDGIKAAFSKASEFFRDTFSDAWQRVCEVFSPFGEIFKDIKDGVLTVFKEVVNGIIRGLNNVISEPFKGINKALSKIRDVNIMGFTPFSGLKTISYPEIPYLAKGAVLPANKPFLAMVGDQKHGTNVEAPLATIQEAVALVMDDYAAANLAGQEAIIGVLREILEAILGIEIGDEIIGQAVERYKRKMAVVEGGT